MTKPSHDLIMKRGDGNAVSSPKPHENSDNKKFPPTESTDPTKSIDHDTLEVSVAFPEDDQDTTNIKTAATPSSSSHWNSMLYSLLLYKARWGDMNVPSNDPEYSPLHTWIQEQRTAYKLYQEQGLASSSSDAAAAVTTMSDGLNPDRISVLDTIGFAWNIRGDVFWQKHYDSLVAYRLEHGDVKVPRLFSKNPKLGEWVTDQRRQLKAKLDGRPSMMTDERKEKLDAIGFLWKVRERADWNDRYEQLLEYKKENGHCVVPQHYAQNRALGKWVAKQREQYRFYHAGKHSFLTEERIDLLKSLGFVWRVKGKGKGEPIEDDQPNDGDGEPIKAKDDEDGAVAPKKRKKTAAKKSSKKAKKEESETSDIDDDDEDVEEDDEAGLNTEASRDTEKLQATSTDTTTPMPTTTATTDLCQNISSMNGMGLLASVTDQMNGGTPVGTLQNAAGVPTLPSLPTDQQLFFAAEQQHAARASMLETFAARANQQMEFAQQRAMANSQTMADIAAALARQSRFGNGFAGSSSMGMFSNMPGVQVPNIPGDMGDPDENLRISRMI